MRFDGHLVQSKESEILRLCLIFNNQLGIEILEGEFFKHLLYFVESTNALIKFYIFIVEIMFIMPHVEGLHDNLHNTALFFNNEIV